MLCEEAFSCQAPSCHHHRHHDLNHAGDETVDDGHERLLAGASGGSSAASSSSSSFSSSRLLWSGAGQRMALCCLGAAAMAALTGTVLLVMGGSTVHGQQLLLAEPAGTIQESPDEIYEFFDDSTPIEGSEHWATCWHWDIRQCPRPHQNRCCCKPGFIFVRKMSSPMLRAVAAFEGSKSKSLGKKSLEGMVGAFQGVATQQLEGECMKPGKFPSSIAKEVED